MKDLSIIVPFAGEYPQALFTVQSIAQSLIGKIDFEIIVVDNHCDELEIQWNNAKAKVARSLIIDGKNMSYEDIMSCFDRLPPKMSTKSSDAFKASEKGNEWLRYMKFDERLSHWECKRLACEAAKSDTFLFIDAHCVPSTGIDKMFEDYKGLRGFGSLHMPLTYKILEWHKLIYKMVVEKSFYGYSFTSFKDLDYIYNVPCMSTCGMMISREIYDKIGGWPKGMFAYGGGENFMNYALAVCGFEKFIYPFVTLHHHGEGRDYHYTYDGTLFNRLLAHYLFGGLDKLNALLAVSKGKPQVLKMMADDILDNEDTQNHRKLIKQNTENDLDEWVDSWRNVQNES